MSDKNEQPAVQLNAQPLEPNSSLWRDTFTRLKRNKLAMIGFWFLLVLVVVSLLTPFIAPYAYEDQDLYLGATPPSAEHWL